MNGKFIDRFAAGLDLMLPPQIFLVLAMLLATLYYVGVESGMIAAGSWSPYAYLIGPALLAASMCLTLLLALFRAVRRAR